MKYTLVSAEERHALAPDTFELLPCLVRYNVQVGKHVKLIFEGDTGLKNLTGERMWVQVTEHKNGRYKGYLESEPAFLRDVRTGEEVNFGPEHIVQIYG